MIYLKGLKKWQGNYIYPGVRFFADAVRDYIEKHRNEKILETLNEVYSEAETEEERRLRMQGKRRHAKFLKAEKW